MTHTFDAKTTALVLIDLQNGILAMDTAPYPTADVLEKGKALAARFRDAGAAVVLVNVDFGPGMGNAPRNATDAGLSPATCPPHGRRWPMALRPRPIFSSPRRSGAHSTAPIST